MTGKLFSLGLLALLSSSLGCAMCCSPDDPNYGAYGGRWQRHDQAYGRVGSVFDEAGFDALETEVQEPTVATEEEADSNFAGSTPEADGTEVELTAFIQ
jgi:hypothetical protein